MYYVTKTNSKGQPLYQVVEKYKDPLTDKWRTVLVSNLVRICQAPDNKKGRVGDRTAW